MNKTSNIVIVLLSVLAVVLLSWFYFFSDDKGNKYQWSENLQAGSDQPYGLQFIRKLLESYRPDAHFVFNQKKSLKKILDSASVEGQTDYIFIGHGGYLLDSDVEALVSFVKNGNDAMIISSTEPSELLTRIYFQECGEELGYYTRESKESITTNFFHDTLKTSSGYTYRYRYGAKDEPYYWQQITSGVFCDATKSIVPLGYHDSLRVDFIKIPVEKGNVYLHCNPILFTNYFLTQRDKVDYAAGVFSHLKGKNIIWDEYTKIPLSGDRTNRNQYDSPLYYILQQPSLKYAWWLLLITTVLYVFFAAKRKQRVIPVLETKSNTSLEYVNLISTLHYNNGNHLDMARKKMKYFLYFIRSRYGVSTDHIKEEQIKRIADKSRMNIEDVRNIFNQYSYIEKLSHNIEVNRLLNLYYAIENFYQKCK